MDPKTKFLGLINMIRAEIKFDTSRIDNDYDQGKVTYFQHLTKRLWSSRIVEAISSSKIQIHPEWFSEVISSWKEKRNYVIVSRKV